MLWIKKFNVNLLFFLSRFNLRVYLRHTPLLRSVRFNPSVWSNGSRCVNCRENYILTYSSIASPTFGINSYVFSLDKMNQILFHLLWKKSKVWFKSRDLGYIGSRQVWAEINSQQWSCSLSFHLRKKKKQKQKLWISLSLICGEAATFKKEECYQTFPKEIFLWSIHHLTV